ncbi:MAG: xanthine dehydrogenase family protein molybdopterin-binding subunit [Actinomycetota bacterium]|nr:xanthine dehydrogenase family protein molybdopterin-binding subunit [Actinomycetota bacterium]
MIGQRVRRREDPRFITGHGQYVDDLDLPGLRHITFVRSDWAHARIVSIDASPAAALDGVEVFTAADVDLGRMTIPFPVPVDERVTRPYLAQDTVRYVGEIVALVVSDTREQGVDAAELVAVEFDPLPVITDPREALRDEVLLFADVGSNVILHQAPESPDPDLFAACEVTISGATTSQRVAVAPIEPRACAARAEPDGTLTVWSSTQTPHADRDGLVAALGLEPDQIRLIAPDVGGGFGGKGLGVEETLVTWVAHRTGQTVRWTETRGENMVGMGHGRGQSVEFELGGDRDGTIRALRTRMVQEVGAYAWVGAVLPTLTGLMSSGVYAIGRIETSFSSVVTNTTPTGAYRGAGRPEATQFLERAVDQFAAELRLDPADVRRRNFIARDAFPYTTATGAEYDCGDYGQALALALQAAGYEDLRAQQAARRAAGDQSLLGIGMAVYVEVTNGGAESEFGEVQITAAGDAVLKTGSCSHGQGHETTFAQIVAEYLGMPVQRITVIKGDTAQVARGGGTYGSKSTQIGGVAARAAAEQTVQIAKRLAAEQLEADPHDMVLDAERGRFHVTGAPEPALDWTGLASALDSAGRLGELTAQNDFAAPKPTFPFGAHVAVVEVDAETGKVALARMIAVDDAGRIINPMIADGQIHGGVAAGIAQAIHEEMAYDEDGNPLNANFLAYGIPSASEFPQFELVRMETPTPVNPLGAKGIGESGTIGSTPAVHNAVIDALSHLGIRHLDMPVNGERVWRAIMQATVSPA